MVKHLYLTCLICMTFLLGGCGNRAVFLVVGQSDNANHVKNLDIIEADAETVETTESVVGLSASFQDDNIIITDSDNDSVLCEIPIPSDKNMLCISMTDENNGCLLYCSTPGAGLMNKYLYITEDRWTTYEEKDLSSLIDGYPTSLSALSLEHIYIGTQMRSNGYLFETIDGGITWDSVSVDEGYYRYGYVPLLDENNGVMYVFLEYEEDNRSYYNLYQSDINATLWEKIGSYSLEGMSPPQECRFFMSDGTLYFYDSQGNRYQITL